MLSPESTGRHWRLVDLGTSRATGVLLVPVDRPGPCSGPLCPQLQMPRWKVEEFAMPEPLQVWPATWGRTLEVSRFTQGLTVGARSAATRLVEDFRARTAQHCEALACLPADRDNEKWTVRACFPKLPFGVARFQWVST